MTSVICRTTFDNIFMVQNIQGLLKKIGLQEKEITVYLYGLSHPPLPVSVLGAGCHLSRTNTYDVVKSLSEKGLCQSISGEYGRKIVMTPPKEFLKILNRRKNEISLLEDELQESLTEFSAHLYRGPVVHPRVTYFEGVEGLRKLFATSLQTQSKKLSTILSLQNVIDVLGREFVLQYTKDRVSRGVYARTLRPNRIHDSHPLMTEHKHALREVRYLPKTVKTDAGVLIFDNKVAFITTYEQPFGTLIESIDFATTMQSYFDTLWIISKVK